MTEPDKFFSRIYWALLLGCGLVCLFQIVSMANLSRVWDDAFMYVRYANNIVSQGKASWNPGGEATYGLTSPFYLLVVLAVRSWVSGNAGIIALVSSTICGFGFIGLVLFTVNRYLEAERQIKRVFLLFLFFYLAVSIELFSTHLVSGMDTTFALLYLAGYIYISKNFERDPTTGNSLFMGIWGGFAYFARPDLMLYSFLVPGTMFFFAKEKETRKNSWLVLKITLGILAGQLLLASYYFHSFFPLPFYVKAFKYYGDLIYKNYRQTAGIELSRYFKAYKGLFLIIGAAIFMNPKEWWKNGSSLDKGLLLASLVFILYYRLLVLQIMHLQSRFYYPTLAAVIFLASQGVMAIARKIPYSFKGELKKLPKAITLAAVFFLLPYLFISLIASFANMRRSFSLNILRDSSVMESYRRNWNANWFVLDKFSRLGDDLVIAATEVGCPGVLNPRKTIIDLAGLNETDFAHQGFSADLFFKKYRPDLIYIPHPHYEKMIHELTRHPVFIKDYEYFKRSDISWALLGIAIRKDSRYYPAMRKMILKEIEDRKGKMDFHRNVLL
ncbi:MAG: hypothetical protein ACE5GM_03605 [bacterium]